MRPFAMREMVGGETILSSNQNNKVCFFLDYILGATTTRSFGGNRGRNCSPLCVRSNDNDTIISLHSLSIFSF